ISYRRKHNLNGSLVEVNSHNHLGIYLGKETATVVCLGGGGRERKVIACFSVSLEGQEAANMPKLGSLIAQACAERDLRYSEVSLALDCSMNMEHNLHSEFTDPKQIASTIKFDTIVSSGDKGSELAVFTSKRRLLSDIIHSCQSNNIDPQAIEPDVYCLSRFIRQNVLQSEGPHPFFAMFSRGSGYFILFSELQKALVLRTFLVSQRQDRGHLLSREVPMTVALTESGQAPDCLRVFDAAGSLFDDKLGRKLGMEIEALDLAACAGVDSNMLADCDDMVEFAIAYGAALANAEKSRTINFRTDFMPYLGKKLRFQKAFQFFSIIATIFLLAFGIHTQMKLADKSKPYRELRRLFEEDYSAVMLGKKRPSGAKEATRELEKESRRIKALKSGRSSTGAQSVSSKLTMVLAAFNKCAARTNLKVEKITVTNKSIRLSGNTSSRKNTLALRQAIERAGLKILNDTAEEKGGRDVFVITVEPKK
ncbi:MAG: hypothetical protein ACYSSL_08900, partial [Planctomycetota bacterium]